MQSLPVYCPTSYLLPQSDDELKTTLSSDMYSHQGPEHWENSGRPQYEQATQSLRVVGLHHLDDSQQSLNTWPPQVTHVKTLQIHQASPAADRHINKRHYTTIYVSMCTPD